MVRNKKNCAAQHGRLNEALPHWCLFVSRNAGVASVNQRPVARSLVSCNHWLRSIENNNSYCS